MKEGSHALVRAPKFFCFFSMGKEKQVCLRQREL